MPSIEDWVEPLMVAPALCLGVLDSSRMAGCFQVFQVFQQGPTLLPVVLEGSRGFWTAVEGSGWVWRVLTGSGGYLSGLDITACSWTNLEVSGCLVGVSRQF